LAEPEAVERESHLSACFEVFGSLDHHPVVSCHAADLLMFVVCVTPFYHPGNCRVTMSGISEVDAIRLRQAEVLLSVNGGAHYTVETSQKHSNVQGSM
jgi:hypothetical protein